MTSQELAEKILAIAEEGTSMASLSFTADRMDELIWALVSIMKLCKQELAKG